MTLGWRSVRFRGTDARVRLMPGLERPILPRCFHGFGPRHHGSWSPSACCSSCSRSSLRVASDDGTTRGGHDGCGGAGRGRRGLDRRGRTDRVAGSEPSASRLVRSGQAIARVTFPAVGSQVVALRLRDRAGDRARSRVRNEGCHERVRAVRPGRRGAPVDGFDFTDITYHRAVDHGTVRIAFDRPEVRNAFRPQTVDELYRALDHARMTSDVGCVLLTGNGPSPKDGGWAFCSGGDQRIRGQGRLQVRRGRRPRTSIDPGRTGRLHILEVQRLIRFMPKVVICVVPGWAAGGGHSLHVVCDLTLASREHARFKQTDADVASFDGGFGSAYLARQVGQKFAREIFFLGRRVLRRRRAPDGHGQRGRRPRRARATSRSSGAARSTARARPRSAC